MGFLDKFKNTIDSVSGGIDTVSDSLSGIELPKVETENNITLDKKSIIMLVVGIIGIIFVSKKMK